MAEQGRRDVVGDPLSLNVGAQPAVRDLSTTGVRNPGQTGGNAAFNDMQNTLGMLGELSGAISEVVAKEAEDWQVKGQLAYMQGVTEEEINASGNKYSVQGWQSMSAADNANRWFADEVSAIENGYNQMDPNEYAALLNERRAARLSELPDDPVVRKVYAAAFSDLGPRLVEAQVRSHNDFNHNQLVSATTDMLSSGGYVNADATRVMPGGSPLAVSPGVVRETVPYTDKDLDALTWTILGEAAGEGPTGMAAVAHTVVNRSIKGGKSIYDIAHEPAQYSTWNRMDKEGNDPVGSYPKNSRRFEQARDIALTVLSGHNPDPTGGAVHFINEATVGTMPSWWAQAVADSGGTVQIGNHTFAGKGYTPPNDEPGGNLTFKNKGQENIDPTFAGVLSSTGKQLGIDLTINSGYRSPSHNAKVGGAKGSSHTHGEAADIDMTGMSDAEKAQLVQTLRANGAMRFIAYSNDPNMLHVDMSMAQGGEWFMFDKKNENMGKAPDWFKQIAATPRPTGSPLTGGSKDKSLVADTAADPGMVADERGVVTSTTPSGAQTQLQQALRLNPLPNDEKATILATSLITDLGAGSTQLWTDSGGLGMLRELGATPTQVKQVQAAYAQYEKQKLNDFDLETVTWQADTVDAVASGKIGRDEALAEIKSRVDSNALSDEAAKSLASQVITAARSAGKTDEVYNMPDAARRAVENTYRAIRNQDITAEQASARMRMISEQWDIPEKQTEQLIGDMWSTERTAVNQAEADVIAAAAKRDKDLATIDEINYAVSHGTIGQLSGEAPNGMSKKQFAVNQVKTMISQGNDDAVAMLMEEGMDSESAKRTVDASNAAQIYSILRKNGVVDEDLQTAFTAASVGRVTDNKGNVNQSTLDAFDMFLQLSNNPQVGEAYLADYFKDQDGRVLMMTAKSLYAGDFSIKEALIRAEEMILNRSSKAPVDAVSNTTVNKQIREVLNTDWDKVVANGLFDGYNIPQSDQEYAKANQADLKYRVDNLAQVINLQQGGVMPEVAAKMAAQDVLKNTIIVAGSYLYGNHKEGTRVDQVMGLQGYPVDEPDRALRDFIGTVMDEEVATFKATGKDPGGRAKIWDEGGTDLFGRGLSMAGGGAANAFRSSEIETLPYRVDYDQYSGLMTVRFFKDQTRTDLAEAEPIVVRAQDVGELWLKKSTVTEANPLQQFLIDMNTPREEEPFSMGDRLFNPGGPDDR